MRPRATSIWATPMASSQVNSRVIPLASRVWRSHRLKVLGAAHEHLVNLGPSRLTLRLGQVDGQEPSKVAVAERVVLFQQQGRHLELEGQPGVGVARIAIDKLVNEVGIVGAIAHAAADREAAIREPHRVEPEPGAGEGPGLTIAQDDLGPSVKPGLRSALFINHGGPPRRESRARNRRARSIQR